MKKDDICKKLGLLLAKVEALEKGFKPVDYMGGFKDGAKFILDNMKDDE